MVFYLSSLTATQSECRERVRGHAERVDKNSVESFHSESLF